MLTAPNLSELDWLVHGFGCRDSIYPAGIETVRQIHSALVKEAPAPGAEADALISDRPGVLVGVRTADCVPVLIADSRTHAVAAVHAGWRGTAKNIVSAAIDHMSSRYGSKPAELHVAIGPSIGQCCYEVSREVALQFETWIPEMTHLDLPEINALQLRQLGIENIWKAGECTYCSADRYFSFRREKEQAGRMISFVGIKSA